MDNAKDIIIGEIDLTTPRERMLEYGTTNEAMVNLGTKGKNKFGVSYIKVKGNEGGVPHFHIESKGTSLYCCVCIFIPMYFNHTHTKDEVKLNTDQKWILNEYLKVKLNNGKSNWDIIVDAWNQANYNKDTFEIHCKKYKLDKNNLSQPNYTEMEDSCV